jgi:hypothetical protein
MIASAGLELPTGRFIAADTGAVSFVFLEFLGVDIRQALFAICPVRGCPLSSNGIIPILELLRQ